MFRVKIADLLIDLITDEASLPKCFENFKTSEKKLSNLNVNIKSSPLISKPKNAKLLHNEINWQSNNSVLSAYLYDSETDRILMRLNIDESLNNSSILYLEEYCNYDYSITGPLGEILFRNKILHYGGLVIHSAAIEHEGKGIIFSAQSETGKSTQARLWQQHMGARTLNGDRPAIRAIGSKPFVYGTPWSGSSSDFTNSSAPLSAIIMLEQAPENSITSLSKSKAVSYLLPRCFLPYQDSNLMNMAINNLEEILSITPVYLLRCRPDKEAVELVYKCVK
jgi:hypothetical protein